MEEEFLESEVIFSDECEHNFQEMFAASQAVRCNNNRNHNSSPSSKKKKKKKQSKKKRNSVPINIPENVYRISESSDEFEFEDELEEEDGDGSGGGGGDERTEFVPPHVILGRRIAGKMAFSVCSGNGRRLKGRDLSEVRNSILRMTGFLET